ncbi:hypothetical protein [Chitinibacter tainanensis]|uniref:hypothetical protein n=1 Tax=Chitinibacter tainanensis TaxID=230667 RepID=UPI000491D9CC|nr:hypothetical protein [Chitinibacter tainanensis]
MTIIATCIQLYNNEKPVFYISAISLIAALAYICCMLIYPFYVGGWQTAHAVWYDWQTFNAGILAYFSTLILFSISRYHSLQQRRRELIAARSLLSNALAALTEHNKKCAKIILEGYKHLSPTESHKSTSSLQPPQIPNEHLSTFEKCIILANPQISERLAEILRELQKINSRLDDFMSFSEAEDTPLNLDYINATLIRLGIVQVMINELFPYSRGDEQFHPPNLEWKILKNAYLNLGIDLDLNNLGNLENKTKEWIKNENGQWRL